MSWGQQRSHTAVFLSTELNQYLFFYLSPKKFVGFFIVLPAFYLLCFVCLGYTQWCIGSIPGSQFRDHSLRKPQRVQELNPKKAKTLPTVLSFQPIFPLCFPHSHLGIITIQKQNSHFYISSLALLFLLQINVQNQLPIKKSTHECSKENSSTTYPNWN